MCIRDRYKNGKKIEILVNFCPKLHYVSEWWKQLYGESEGKDNKGIFPAAVDFSTDPTLWDSGFRKVNVLSSKQLSL